MTTSAPAPLSVADMTLRPATLEDAAFASDVATAAQPRDPEDPLLWRNWWKDEELVLQVERFIVWLEGRAVGFALRRHPSEASERFERLSAELLPPARTTARLQALLALLESRAAAEGARRFTAWAWDRDGLLNGALAKRGFREERRQRYWELHLGRNRERLERMTSDSRERMRAQGIRILTVAEDDDPEKYQKLWRMTDEAERDIPRSTPFVASPFHAFMEWMRSPGLREDRTWIARVVPAGPRECRHRLDRHRSIGAGTGSRAGAEVRDGAAGDRARRGLGAHRQRLPERADPPSERIHGVRAAGREGHVPEAGRGLVTFAAGWNPGNRRSLAEVLPMSGSAFFFAARAGGRRV